MSLDGRLTLSHTALGACLCSTVEVRCQDPDPLLCTPPPLSGTSVKLSCQSYFNLNLHSCLCSQIEFYVAKQLPHSNTHSLFVQVGVPSTSAGNALLVSGSSSHSFTLSLSSPIHHCICFLIDLGDCSKSIVWEFDWELGKSR